MPSDLLQQYADQLRTARLNAPAQQPSIEERREAHRASAPKPPDDVSVLSVDAGGVPGEWVCAPGSDDSRRLLYFHGGGYSVGSPQAYRRLAADLSRGSGWAVLALDYRLAPEWPLPAAVEDGLASYRWIREHGPHEDAPAATVAIGGDSAGGGLTLSTLVAARDHGVPLTQGAVTISAWTDLAATGKSLTTRSEADPMIAGDAIAGAASDCLGGADARDPRASPLYADLSGLPPLLMLVGDDEVLLDDTLRVAERLRESGGSVDVHVEPGAFHVYPYFVPDAPESRAALQMMGLFLQELG